MVNEGKACVKVPFELAYPLVSGRPITAFLKEDGIAVVSRPNGRRLLKATSRRQIQFGKWM